MHEELSNLLKQTHGKILFVGIGNVLKNDDAVGVYISRNIKKAGNIESLTVETGIENYIGKINSISPGILVLIDCADMKSEPGTIRLMALEEVQDITFNTHNISLKRLRDFFPMKVFLLGIQPGNIDFGENISYFVRKNADSLLKQINKEVHHGCGISL